MTTEYESPSPSAPAPLVLIADNDQNVSAILREFLVRRGLEVEVVGDGRRALDRLAVGGVSVLVCDLDMPVMSGEALLEARRVASPDGHPPVVVISGYVDEPVAERLRALPAVHEILRKPFDVRAFADLVEELARAVPATDGGTAGLFDALDPPAQKSPGRP